MSSWQILAMMRREGTTHAKQTTTRGKTAAKVAPTSEPSALPETKEQKKFGSINHDRQTDTASSLKKEKTEVPPESKPARAYDGLFPASVWARPF